MASYNLEACQIAVSCPPKRAARVYFQKETARKNCFERSDELYFLKKIYIFVCSVLISRNSSGGIRSMHKIHILSRRENYIKGNICMFLCVSLD